MMINQVSVGELQTNCWIISLPRADRESSGGECILVDPGGDGDLILDRLKRLLLRPRYIVLTHAHFDHIAALPELAAAYPAAAIAAHPAETAKLGPHSLEPHRRDFGGAAAYVEALWKPLPEASLLLAEGAALGPFTTLHLPGHSPGSIGLLWEEEKILISGDTLFNAGVGRTDLPGGSQEELNRSLTRLFTLDGDTTVYPGHGPVTAIRREKAY
ncbi:MAG: MBL fold metallo-hydrolase [Spirochaetaceae bacterium]|jgi:glyoxylase-like metal-dependent hydrolase (beta-lactamase superfamily II)|nr:MBL fold metallo-hydrolase [Spirochaetaceae bacterium]